MSDLLKNLLPTAWLTSASRFILEIDDVQIGTFTEVSGLNAEIAVEKIEEGGQNQFVHQMPGRVTWPNITLKRGVVDDDNLFEWFTKTSGDGLSEAGNKVSMHSGAVTLLSQSGDRLRSWKFDRAFPVKWTGPTFAVTSTEVPTEELEIAHHGFSSKRG
ncbi:MAG: phage tail protein [Ilumatobacter sp.]